MTTNPHSAKTGRYRAPPPNHPQGRVIPAKAGTYRRPGAILPLPRPAII